MWLTPVPSHSCVQIVCHMWHQYPFSMTWDARSSEIWGPLCRGWHLTARASLQVINHDTRRFRFALPRSATR